MALLLCTGAKAQTYVTIPDPVFVSYLHSNYSSCMSGNQMDITCSAILSATYVDVNSLSISDLSGIQYFSALQTLNCSGNLLVSIPSLPSTVKTFNCSYNQLSALPALPSGLTSLDCSANPLYSLPALPANLQTLVCNNDFLTTLPVLPLNLFSLEAAYNQLTSLPTLPNMINTLGCSENQITNLPPLPGSLAYLYCSGNDLSVLPALGNLNTLNCSDNPLYSLPALPNSMQYLTCRFIHLTNLPALPLYLKKLDCELNDISSLPALPSSLLQLDCGYNSLTALPALPAGLQLVQCSYNNLTLLPSLPSSLITLSCTHNLLTDLPVLPATLQGFYCEENNISCFPVFPSSLTHSTWFSFLPNPVACLPNYVSAMNSAELSIPLCLSSNPYGCSEAQGIAGNIYNDVNLNCVLDPGDVGLVNVPVKLHDAADSLLCIQYSYSNGIYNFPQDSSGVYKVSIDTANLSCFIQCPYPGNDSTVILTPSQMLAPAVSFGIGCKPGFDLGVKAVTPHGSVVPGVQHLLTVRAGDLSSWYGLHCAAGVSGQVKITVTGPVVFDSIFGGVIIPSVAGNTYTFNVGNFGYDQEVFGMLFTTDSTATSLDQVCVTAEVSLLAGDSDSTNNTYNFCYHVNNSYDPNMKETYPVSVPPGYDDWFTYTIHFQNTGNSPAININVKDTLSGLLDEGTFEVIGYSHPLITTITENKINFRFPGIMLPDSASAPQSSIGYVQYRVKPEFSYPSGTLINNTASIYFDYNAPVVTNTTVNEFVEPLAVSAFAEDVNFSVYPNPGTGMFNVSVPGTSGKVQRVEVYNLLGELLLSERFAGNSAVIDLSGQPEGIYILRLNGSLNRRLVKQ